MWLGAIIEYVYVGVKEEKNMYRTEHYSINDNGNGNVKDCGSGIMTSLHYK